MDGNKRIGLSAAGIFLLENDFELDASEEDAAAVTWRFAAGDMEESEFAEWLRRECVPASDT